MGLTKKIQIKKEYLTSQEGARRKRRKEKPKNYITPNKVKRALINRIKEHQKKQEENEEAIDNSSKDDSNDSSKSDQTSEDEKLKESEDDVNFLKDQITTSEVNMARVYNQGVANKKAADPGK